MDNRIREEVARLRSRSKNVRLEELRRLWERSGGEVRAPKRGSHHKFVLGRMRVIVPYRRGHVDAVYVVEVLDKLEEHLRE